MSPVTGLARLPERIVLSVSMGNFSPIDRDEIQETKLKWCHKVASFATIVRLVDEMALSVCNSMDVFRNHMMKQSMEQVRFDGEFRF